MQALRFFSRLGGFTGPEPEPAPAHPASAGPEPTVSLCSHLVSAALLVAEHPLARAPRVWG